MPASTSLPMYVEDFIDDFVTTHSNLFMQELTENTNPYTHRYSIQSSTLGIHPQFKSDMGKA
jgi:hypothetical protein